MVFFCNFLQYLDTLVLSLQDEPVLMFPVFSEWLILRDGSPPLNVIINSLKGTQRGSAGREALECWYFSQTLSISVSSTPALSCWQSQPWQTLLSVSVEVQQDSGVLQATAWCGMNDRRGSSVSQKMVSYIYQKGQVSHSPSLLRKVSRAFYP